MDLLKQRADFERERARIESDRVNREFLRELLEGNGPVSRTTTSSASPACASANVHIPWIDFYSDHSLETSNNRNHCTFTNLSPASSTSLINTI